MLNDGRWERANMQGRRPPLDDGALPRGPRPERAGPAVGPGLSVWERFVRPVMVGCAVVVVTSGTAVWLVLMCRFLHALLT